MKKILLVIIALFLGLSACVERSKEFHFEEDNLKIQINEVVPLPISFTNLTFDEITFTYSNPNIIEIDYDVIIPLNIGTTTLTATYKDISDSIEIEVTPILPNLSVSRDILEIGQTVKLNLNNFKTKDFDWFVSDETVIDLSENFIIRALDVGKATITATHKTDPTLNTSITIEVIQIRPQVVTTLSYLRVGDQTKLVIANLDQTGFQLDDYYFKISDESIITIDNDCVITALHLGEATITATLKINEKCFNSITIVVTEPTTEKTSLNEPASGPLMFELENIEGKVKAGEEFIVDIIGSNSLYNYHWLPDDMAIVRVTEDGVVLGAKAGRTRIVVISKENSEIRGEFYITVEGMPNVNYRKKLVEIADAEVGYIEGPDNANKYGVWYRYNNAPWCAIFVSWCANQAGISTDIIIRYCLCSEGVRWFEKQGNYYYREEYEPQAGDIIFFQSKGNISHTGIVTGCDGTYVYTIEGNTSNAVLKCEYFLTNTYIHGYGVPNYPDYHE